MIPNMFLSMFCPLLYNDFLFFLHPVVLSHNAQSRRKIHGDMIMGRMLLTKSGRVEEKHILYTTKNE